MLFCTVCFCTTTVHPTFTFLQTARNYISSAKTFFTETCLSKFRTQNTSTKINPLPAKTTQNQIHWAKRLFFVPQIKSFFKRLFGISRLENELTNTRDELEATRAQLSGEQKKSEQGKFDYRKKLTDQQTELEKTKNELKNLNRKTNDLERKSQQKLETEQEKLSNMERDFKRLLNDFNSVTEKRNKFKRRYKKYKHKLQEHETTIQEYEKLIKGQKKQLEKKLEIFIKIRDKLSLKKNQEKEKAVSALERTLLYQEIEEENLKYEISTLKDKNLNLQKKIKKQELEIKKQKQDLVLLVKKYKESKKREEDYSSVRLKKRETMEGDPTN